MNKTTRLLSLMQVLRARQRPVTAQHLADRLAVSVRTVYRDIDALVHLGAAIDGSAGVGYELRSGFFLPPLMFSDEEIEALVLGARWVDGQGDSSLSDAAASAIAKIASAGPAAMREKIAETALWAPRARHRADHGGPGLSASHTPGQVDTAMIRQAIRQERKLRLDYRDAAGAASGRVIWPIALGFFEGGRVAAAWCELRNGFRHFRVDRMVSLEWLGEGYPTPRKLLVRSWRAHQRVSQARRAAAGS